MRKLTPATVFLHSKIAENLQHWRSLLDGRGHRVWDNSNEIPDDAAIDLLLTDDPAANALLSQADSRWNDWQAGIVVVGPESQSEQSICDACVPPSIEHQQLLLVCELVGEIARLRRRCRQGGRQRRLLGHLAMTDPLTGLPNRWAWEEEIRRRTELARQARLSLCIALLDLDEFKTVNDTLGHPRGDAVLRAAAHELVGQLRQEDFVARLGGDEFGLLLFVDGPQSASAVVERVRSGVAVESANDQWITASAGFAVYQPMESDDFARAYNSADQALHEAKRGGRNRTVGATTADNASAHAGK